MVNEASGPFSTLLFRATLRPPAFLEGSEQPVPLRSCTAFWGRRPEPSQDAAGGAFRVGGEGRGEPAEAGGREAVLTKALN